MKQRLTNYLLRYLLSAVVAEDVISKQKGKIYMGKREIHPMELRSLVAEAKALKEFRIWRIMNETIRSDAMDRGFNKSMTFDDLKTCKLMLYNLDVLNSVIKNILEAGNVV